MRWHIISSWAALVSVSVVMAGCPPPDDGGGSGFQPKPQQNDEEVSEAIGPTGGTVALGDEARVIVPTGALNSETDIVIARTPAGQVPLLGETTTLLTEVYAFKPHGTAFDVDVTIGISVEQPAANMVVMRLDDGSDDAWEAVATAVASGGEVSFQSDRFSFYAIAQGMLPSPDGGSPDAGAQGEAPQDAGPPDAGTDDGD